MTYSLHWIYLALFLVPAETFQTTLTRHKTLSRSNTAQAFIRRPAALAPLYARKKANGAPDGSPDDWNEDDVLEEFEGGNDVDIEALVEEEEEEVVATDDVESTSATSANINDEYSEDDDEEIDETAFEDEEEEDEGLVEEVVGESAGEWDGEEEAQYETSVESSDIEWDEDEDGGDYELDDDPDDPNYMFQKELVDAAIKASEQRASDETFDPLDFVMNEITPEQEDEINQLPLFKEVEERAKNMMLSVEDVEDIDLQDAVNTAPDLIVDDPFPRQAEGEVNVLDNSFGISEDAAEKFDSAVKDVHDTLSTQSWDKVMLRADSGFEGLSNTTLEEMEACLEEIGGSAYNVTRWLLYDLDFNVSNLILAAVKHNKEAPIIFQHWYPQLLTYSRYKHAQDRNFDFSWDDVQNADIAELERYYLGFGYDEIPHKAPAETGIISLEDLDEEEIKMAAFENWMREVYNPEWDRKDFDDDNFQDEDNVFSDFFEAPQHPDEPVFQDAVDDINAWKEDIGDDPSVQAYRDKMGQSFDYEVEEDEEFQREFRGHLVVACTGMDSDLDIAEKITLRFQKEFGKKVFVETRVLALAREEDNVFEIWLESYEVELLHSKKRATSNAKDWTGPVDVDDKQVDYLVDRVRFLISDDSRYSYRYEFEKVE